jgi:hypothetical protein
MYGSYECVQKEGKNRWVCSVSSSGVRKSRDEGRTHLVQVNDTHSNFTQTLSPVDIGLGCPGDTTAAELRTDSILGRKRVNVGLRCSDALYIKPGNLQKEISCVSYFERLYIPIEWKATRVGVKRKKGW